MTAMLSNADVARHIHASLGGLQVVPLDMDLPEEPSIGRVRRRGRTSLDDGVGVVTLLEVDGVLMWEDGAVSGVPCGPRRLRGSHRGAVADGEVVTQLKYQKPLGVSAIVERLSAFDAMLTPRAANEDTPGSALLEFDPAWNATPGAVPRANGRILLLIHGTFSSSENMAQELRLNPGDLKALRDNYDQVLGFDHFTVSRTPVVNAADLARRFAKSKAELHVLCHSRGGLVARWFCEMLDRRPDRRRRVVFVGCPLQGTSLADPASLRNGLNLMTNIGKALGEGFTLVPFLAAAGGLMQILSSMTSVAARTPLVDAGIGLLPGIAAMSRIQRHAELCALNHGDPMERKDYFAVSSNFRAQDAGWKFWRFFNGERTAELAADHLVFGRENDLVVDTSSMTYHAWGPAPDLTNRRKFCVFDDQSGVHHTAYFRQPRTLEFITQSFATAKP